jgi:hypothetical protein
MCLFQETDDLDLNLKSGTKTKNESTESVNSFQLNDIMAAVFAARHGHERRVQVLIGGSKLPRD